MDVWGVFVGDSTLSYGGSVRNSNIRDYEQFPYGTFENSSSSPSRDSYSKVQEKCRQVKSVKAQKKECPFCREQKKRPLTTYMRKRESRKHHDSICEEHEEEIEEKELQTTSMEPANVSLQ
ncbi:uncharacterized protein LOC129247178 [Anastrepha obliqua]|uniref:uncharacterized protein LOC128864293 n=1 Tax=Anastrepha ludens TaxID=28586 RepID=UPI0023B147C4|nr:uncharacterized protein LOC128864293 [Anastrepha ludens]XP_054742146.1 uncharacterized protein LOC129247178 [Anastrepha obliqua]